MLSDQPREEHLRTFAACDVCLALSRWEGLGLPLYESIAFGMPVITNDKPPMNEAIIDGVNGILVASRPDGHAGSGIKAYKPKVNSLSTAIESLGDPELRAQLSDGARKIRDGERRWSHTVEGMAGLIAQLNHDAPAPDTAS